MLTSVSLALVFSPSFFLQTRPAGSDFRFGPKPAGRARTDSGVPSVSIVRVTEGDELLSDLPCEPNKVLTSVTLALLFS